MKKGIIIFVGVLMLSLSVVFAGFPYTDYDGFVTTANETFTSLNANWSSTACYVENGLLACEDGGVGSGARYVHELIDVDTQNGYNYTLFEGDIAVYLVGNNGHIANFLHNNGTASSDRTIELKEASPNVNLRRCWNGNTQVCTGWKNDGTIQHIKATYGKIGASYYVSVYINGTLACQMEHDKNCDESAPSPVKYFTFGNNQISTNTGAKFNVSNWVSYNGTEYLKSAEVIVVEETTSEELTLSTYPYETFLYWAFAIVLIGGIILYVKEKFKGA